MRQLTLPLLVVITLIGAPELAMAQASPFLTGATSLQTNLLAWLTPIAVILVMVLGGLAMANRVSWGSYVVPAAKMAGRRNLRRD
jgi:TrbC/VIRB2 pilin